VVEKREPGLDAVGHGVAVLVVEEHGQVERGQLREAERADRRAEIERRRERRRRPGPQPGEVEVRGRAHGAAARASQEVGYGRRQQRVGHELGLQDAGVAMERAGRRRLAPELAPAAAAQQAGEVRAEIAMVTAERLVGALPVEHHEHAAIPREAAHAPLRVDAGGAERLILVPREPFELLQQTFCRGHHGVARGAGRRHHLRDEAALVIARDVRPGGERVLPRRPAVAELRAHGADQRR